MQTIQMIVILLVLLALAYLVIDGWITRAVWVKGARNGLFSFREPAHKRGRDEDPWPYWFAMGFYALAMVCLGLLLLIG